MTFVLLYHDVADAASRDSVGFPGPLAARYKLDPALFREHLDAIAAAGVHVGLIDPPSRMPDAVLTFDDAGASAALAAAELERRGWRGYFFVPTSRLDTDGFLGAEDVRDLAAKGHVVGSHSHSHPTYMGLLSPPELLREWRESRAILADVLGAEPQTASVPGGFLSRAVIESAAEAGYRLLMTSEPTTKVQRLDGLTTVGRYSIWSTTPPERAAAYASGQRVARARLWVEWKTKRLAKRMSPAAYERLRRIRARR